LPLFRPSELFSFLNASGLKAKKHLSQNFLTDGNILQKILHAANVRPGDVVVEIGPGPGALTEALLTAQAKVIAIEKDPSYASALSRLQKENRLVVIQEDALHVDFEAILLKQSPAKLISNVPYHITTPLIASLLPLKHYFISLTLMVQKEVAERICALPKTKDYSAFTLFVQYYAQATYCFTVAPTCFSPRPSVYSAVIRLDLKEKTPKVPPESFFPFVRAAFQQRRKMLRSSLKQFAPPKMIETSLQEIGVSPQARPEELSLEEFLTLSEKTSKCAPIKRD